MRDPHSRWFVLMRGSLFAVGLWVVALPSIIHAQAPLSAERMNTFLNGTHNAILATIKRDGSPQLTPVVYRWDGEKFWISTTKDRAKYKNLMRDPRMSLSIEDGMTGAAVIASGKAMITEENLWEETRKIMERYMGPEGGAGYVKKMQEKGERRVLVVFKPEKIISWTRQ